MKRYDDLIPRKNIEAVFFSHRTAVLSTLLTVIALLLTILTLTVVVLRKQPENRYFATTLDGRLYPLKPLSEPITTNHTVTEYAGRTITDTFTFDYVNFKAQIAKVADGYTEQAFKQVKEDLQKPNGLVTQAIKNKWIVSANVMAAPQMINQGILPGTKTYGWRMSFPMLLTFQTEEHTRTQRYKVMATVIRVNQLNNPRGVEISNLQLIPING